MKGQNDVIFIIWPTLTFSYSSLSKTSRTDRSTEKQSQPFYFILGTSYRCVHKGIKDTFKKRWHYWDRHHWKQRPSWIAQWGFKKTVLFFYLCTVYHYLSLMERSCSAARGLYQKHKESVHVIVKQPPLIRWRQKCLQTRSRNKVSFI